MACDVEFWNTLDPTIVEGSREDRLEAYRTVRDGLMNASTPSPPGAPQIWAVDNSYISIGWHLGLRGN